MACRDGKVEVMEKENEEKLTAEQKKVINEAVDKAFNEYGEALRMLGND
jgi:hypothetical protein